MPFTISHPAAVLPLMRLGLPASALVVGSMVPDLPIYFGWPRGYGLTHSWAGVVTLCPLLALVVLALWFFLLRDPLAELAPELIRSRVPVHAGLTARQWVLAPVAAALGALTHVTWDSFTHGGRWGVERVPWLSGMYGPMPAYAWAQHASTLLGLVAVVTVVASYLRRLPATVPRQPRGTARHLLPGVVVVAAMSAVAAGLADTPADEQSAAFDSAVAGVVGLTVGLVALSVVWRVRAAMSARGDGSRRRCRRPAARPGRAA